MRGKSLLFRITLMLTVVLAMGACTYNYFEAFINYKVYVPEVEAGTVNNCIVLIYDAETGELVAQTSTDDADQTELDKGLFGFFLDNGQYKVCILTNTDSVNVNPGTSLNDGHIAHMLNESTQTFGHTGALHYDYMALAFDGTQPVDTASVKLYPARIDVRFRGNGIDPSKVAGAIITIDNIASMQMFSDETIPMAIPDAIARYCFSSPAMYPADAEGAVFEFTSYLFPTAPGTTLHLTLSLLDAYGNAIGTYEYGLYDQNATDDDGSRMPLSLKCGDRVIVDIFDNGITVSLSGWNENISGSESDIAGQKPQVK